jgi:type I restriction enzyme S subunit
MAKGAVNQANINSKQLASIHIPLPPLSLQQTFAKRIEVIEQQKQQINKTIKDLETLLASRMQYWFD